MKILILILVFMVNVEAGSLQKLKKSCKRKDANSCLDVGILYQMGKRVKKDYKKAKFYYEKACNLKNKEGCMYLADAYYFGEGTSQNYTLAKKYYKHSCKLHHKPACKSLQVTIKEEEQIKSAQKELERLKQEQKQLVLEAELLDNL